MKVTLLVAALLCYITIVASDSCPSNYPISCQKACNPAELTSGCPDHASCRALSTNTGTCTCGDGYAPKCGSNCAVSTTYGCQCDMSCQSVSSSGSGTSSGSAVASSSGDAGATSAAAATSGGDTSSVTNTASSTGKDSGSSSTGSSNSGGTTGMTCPNGCRDGLYCSTTTGTCVCKQDGYFFSETLAICIPKCFSFDANSAYSTATARCVCNAGYVAASTSNSGVYVTCRSNATANSCDALQCGPGTVCTKSDGGQYSCKPSTTTVSCGRGFNCPSDRYDCIDGSTNSYCRCKPGYGGDGCKFVACSTDATSNSLVCPNMHATCVLPPTGIDSSPYCVCAPGWSGDSCNTQDNSCSTVTCADPNSLCREGKCVCKDSYQTNCAYDGSNANNCGCQPINGGPCLTNNPCKGNRRCVPSQDGTTSECVCPAAFGGADCDQPACGSDDDCRKNNNKAYCVKNTNSDVPPFCTCPPGSSGDDCSQQTQCDSTTCGTNEKCSNEGVCECAPGFKGDKCDQTTTCRTVTIFLKFDKGTTPLTADEVEAVIVTYTKVDATSVTVTGPKDTKNERVKEYDIQFCDTGDVSGSKSSSDFDQNKNGSGLPITDPPVPSAASTVIASLALIVALVALLL